MGKSCAISSVPLPWCTSCKGRPGKAGQGRLSHQSSCDNTCVRVAERRWLRQQEGAPHQIHDGHPSNDVRVASEGVHGTCKTFDHKNSTHSPCTKSRSRRGSAPAHSSPLTKALQTRGADGAARGRCQHFQSPNAPCAARLRGHKALGDGVSPTTRRAQPSLTDAHIVEETEAA